MEHPVEGTGPHTICPKFACPSQNFHTYPNESNPDMIGIRRLRPLQGEHLRCQRAREGQHKRRGGERRHHRALVHPDGRLLQGSVHQSRPEKTREVTRPEACLIKIPLPGRDQLSPSGKGILKKFWGKGDSQSWHLSRFPVL